MKPRKPAVNSILSHNSNSYYWAIKYKHYLQAVCQFLSFHLFKAEYTPQNSIIFTTCINLSVEMYLNVLFLVFFFLIILRLFYKGFQCLETGLELNSYGSL